MVSIVQHTIKITFYSGMKCTSQSQQMYLRNLQKKEDGLNKVYGSDGKQAPKIFNGKKIPYAFEKVEIFLPLKAFDMLAAIPKINVKNR